MVNKHNIGQYHYHVLSWLYRVPGVDVILHLGSQIGVVIALKGAVFALEALFLT